MSKKLFEVIKVNDRELSLLNLNKKDLAYFSAFHKNKIKKITFLRFILSFRSLYHHMGYQLNSIFLAQCMNDLGYKVTCQTIRNYLRELDSLEFIVCKINKWSKGNFSKTYVIQNTDILLMFEKYYSEKIGDKQKRYITNLKFVAKHTSSRIEILEEIKTVISKINKFDLELIENINLDITNLEKRIKALQNTRMLDQISLDKFEYSLNSLNYSIKSLRNITAKSKFELPNRVYYYNNINIELLRNYDLELANERTKLFNDFKYLSYKLAKLYQHKELDFFIDFSHYFHTDALQFFSFLYSKIKLDTSPNISDGLVFVSNPLIANGFVNYITKRRKKLDLYYEAKNFLENNLDYFYLESLEPISKLKITCATNIEKTTLLKNKTSGKLIEKLVKNNVINERKTIKPLESKKKVRAKDLADRVRIDEENRIKLLEKQKEYFRNIELNKEIKANFKAKFKAIKDELLKQSFKASNEKPSYISLKPIKTKIKAELNRSLKQIDESKTLKPSSKQKLKKTLKEQFKAQLNKEIKAKLKANKEKNTMAIKFSSIKPIEIDNATYQNMLKEHLKYRKKEKDRLTECYYLNKKRFLNKLNYDLSYTELVSQFNEILYSSIPEYQEIEARSIGYQMISDGRKLLARNINFGNKFIETGEYIYKNAKIIGNKSNAFDPFKFRYVRVDHLTNRRYHVSQLEYLTPDDLKIDVIKKMNSPKKKYKSIRPPLF